MDERYGIKITYSWGDEEEIIPVKTMGESTNPVWEKILQLVAQEIKTVSDEHYDEEFIATVEYNPSDVSASLHYGYDDEYCYYNLVELNKED